MRMTWQASKKGSLIFRRTCPVSTRVLCHSGGQAWGLAWRPVPLRLLDFDVVIPLIAAQEKIFKEFSKNLLDSVPGA
jgi:hypothetical protein